MDKTVKLELTLPMLAKIGQALGRMPFDEIAPVVAEVQRQVNEQGFGVQAQSQVQAGQAAVQ